ncbi:hypothetical protein lerEdw1_017756 [Lerista edwardsae]|nr:hypothetical protein lerEdw1_017756 [Lerista edwardsae]
MSQPRLLAPLLMLVLCLQGSSGQTTDTLYENWKAYSKECYHNMSLLPPPTELVCNRTFDNYSCLPDAQPNTTAKVFCPWYLPWYDQVKHGYVFQKCGPDGQWVTDRNRKLMRDAHQCVNNKTEQESIYDIFQVMYTVGYSVSLGSLLLALAVLLGFRCWSTNNNMGFWWILRLPVFLAILVSLLSSFLVFALRSLKVRSAAQNLDKTCLDRTPPSLELTVLQNLKKTVIVANVDSSGKQLAKSTLTLIPLLGIHEVVFAFVTDEHAQGTLRYVKLFFDLFLGSFQGMLVAILYCFVNKEVQSELMKKWKHWKLGQDMEEEYKHTCSHISNARNKGTSTCEKHKLVGNYLNGMGHSQATMHTSTQYLERTACSASENLAAGERPHCYEFPDTAESNF